MRSETDAEIRGTVLEFIQKRKDGIRHFAEHICIEGRDPDPAALILPDIVFRYKSVRIGETEDEKQADGRDHYRTPGVIGPHMPDDKYGIYDKEYYEEPERV